MDFHLQPPSGRLLDDLCLLGGELRELALAIGSRALSSQHDLADGGLVLLSVDRRLAVTATLRGVEFILPLGTPPHDG